MAEVAEKTLTKGGEFIIRDFTPEEIFIPEQFNEEQRAMAEACKDFLDQEIYSQLDAIDNDTQNYDNGRNQDRIMPNLLNKAGEMGFLSVSVPEEYNGLDLDFTTAMITSEVLGAGHSFSVALLAHTGIGTLPILYFGNEEQKAKYLPKLASGELKACYCLTEPGSGSDALGAKTKAVLNDEGTHYILNGQKMWITNGGFADVLIVFAKIDGEQFTGFILERDFEGISFNEEEKKMGIKGSSTRQIFFQDVKVPKENILGEIGKGHRIAFNILNIGRLKLAAATTGSAKRVIDKAVQYANERHQFQQPLSSFGAIQHKIAEMVTYTWATETATYRSTYDTDMMERSLLEQGKAHNEALLEAAQEFAIECAIMKVFGSECLDYVVDEGVQIYGGYGFSAEFPMDRAYRDSRINRIYEGTNEINLMLSVGTVTKKAMKGQLDLMTPAQNIQKELTSVPDFSNGNGEPLAAEKKLVANFKKAFLMLAGTGFMKYQEKLEHEQELLMAAARALMDTYVAESMLLRVQKIRNDQGEEAAAIPTDMLRLFLFNASERIHTLAKEGINHMASGDEARMMLMGVKRFTKMESFDVVATRRRIAAHAIEQNAYPFA